MKHILIFTLSFLFFGIIKAIIDQIPVLVTFIFIGIAILFTWELIQLLKKEKKNGQIIWEPVEPIYYGVINIRTLNLRKKMILQ